MANNSMNRKGNSRPGLHKYLGSNGDMGEQINDNSGKSDVFGSQRKIRRFVDTDDSAKPAAKPPTRPTRVESMAAKPANNTTNKNDNDVDAKRRIKASSSHGKPALEVLDRDIEAKNRAHRSIMMSVGGTSPPNAAKKPPAKLTTAKLTTAEDEVAMKPTAVLDMTAKNRARSTAGPTMILGAVSIDEDEEASMKPAAVMEMASKNRARSATGPAMIPGAVSVDDSDDDDVKMPARPTTDEDAKNQARPQMGASSIPGAAQKSNEFHAGDRKVAAYASLPRRIEYSPDDDDDHKFNDNYSLSNLENKSKAPGFVSSLEATASVKCLVDPLSEDEKMLPEDVPGLFSDGNAGGELSTMLVPEFYREDVEAGELAVASPVIEEDEGSYIPAAVEFDPDSKPPLYKSRRFRYYSGVGLVFGIVALVIAVVFTQKAGDEISGPTLAPTTFRESLGIQDQIVQLMGSTKLEDENSPHSKALNWLLHEDPMQLPPEADNLLQRYVLALFYFQTSAEGPWRSCNPPSGDETAECAFQSIQAIYPELLFTPVPEIRWLSDRHECDWVGILCASEKVVSLLIRGQQLTGTFPEELAYLPFLRDLSLAVNNLTGPIPTTLASEMENLQDIELNSNYFTGTIPSELFLFENLQRVNLGMNLLTGELAIPKESSISLQSLFLYQNDLVGKIPTELGIVTNLRYLRFSKTLLTGPLPSEIGRLKYLQEVWVHQTSLSGNIPSEIGEMDELSDFRISSTFTSGTIPEELYDLRDLFRIDVSNSNITGTISTSIGQLKSLELFRVRNSRLSGTIPTEFSLLTGLRQVQFELTDLTGVMPEGFCVDSVLLELIADCMVPDGMESAPVACAEGCCSGCCNQITGQCVPYEV